jgi:hypothetical protein
MAQLHKGTSFPLDSFKVPTHLVSNLLSISICNSIRILLDTKERATSRIGEIKKFSFPGTVIPKYFAPTCLSLFFHYPAQTWDIHPQFELFVGGSSFEKFGIR